MTCTPRVFLLSCDKCTDALVVHHAERSLIVNLVDPRVVVAASRAGWFVSTKITLCSACRHKCDPQNVDNAIQIINDGREISYIRQLEQEPGLDGVTSADDRTAISPYLENGQMGAVTWFKIIRDGHVVNRVNSAHVIEIGYCVGEPSDGD